MRSVLAFLLFSFSILCGQGENKPPSYLNYKIPLDERVNDLITRMTLEEKVKQMIDAAEAIPRLNVPEYNWWNEALHGVARSGIATVFPQAIGLASTWDTDLMYNVADVISTEARAKYHEYIRNNKHNRYGGLTFWSPNINIFRDPRWGRGQETYGEDPYLTSRMGVAFVKGLQGDDPAYYKVIATPKHYAVHSGPEPDRHTFNAITNNRDLWETYLPAFEACIKEGGAYSVMCAYNRYMGEACCGSHELLQTILRHDWGFEGYVVSDCGAIDDIYMRHEIVGTAEEASSMAVKAGTDLNCGSAYTRSLEDAVEEGLIAEAELDVALKRLFTARFKLGMFDPPELVKYSQIPIEENDSEEHRKLAVKAAQKSIVLLKNDNLLPLKKDLRKIAVIGPTADSYEMLLGNYHGVPSKYVTPLMGIKSEVASNTEVVYEPGCNLVENGSIIHSLGKEMLSADGVPGLKADYYKNINLEGKPFYSRRDEINSSNWNYGFRIPGLEWGDEFSVRWTGTLNVPESGEYNFNIKCDDGFRLFIDDKLLIEEWQTDQNTWDLVDRSSSIHLDEGVFYNFRMEYFYSSGWPQLTVHWRLLNIDYYQNAIDAASSADVVIFIGGITAQLEGEEMRVNYEGFDGGDRTDLKIPRVQEDLLKLLHATGKPIVLVLTGGSALAVNWEDRQIQSIIQLWYPGEEGGTALADVLFGDYNPAGRLPVTFYKSVDQLPPFDDYNMRNRTYKYFEGDPLYPFGYGLSYTKFKYDNLIIPDESINGNEVKLSVDVTNIGDRAGDEVVQLYIRDIEASVPVPLRSLQGFKRIYLEPGETKTVDFVVTPKQLSLITDNSMRIVEPGIFEISLGGILPGYNSESTGTITGEITITGGSFILK